MALLPRRRERFQMLLLFVLLLTAIWFSYTITRVVRYLKGKSQTIEPQASLALGIHMDCDLFAQQLDMLQNKTLFEWDGPICVAVFDKHAKESNIESSECNKLLNSSKIPPNFQILRRRHWSTGIQGIGKAYPINEMRQLLLARCRSQHLFLVDGHLAPSRSMAMEIETRLTRNSNPTILYVAPVFELCKSIRVLSLCSPFLQGFEKSQSNLWSGIPRDKDLLGECVTLGCCCPFKTENPAAYGATNHSRWLSAESDFELDLLDDFEFERYEPYVVGVRQCMPNVPVRILPYGLRDKAVWHMVMRTLGYRYVVMHDVFLFHFTGQQHVDRVPISRLSYRLMMNRIADIKTKLQGYRSSYKPLAFSLFYPTYAKSLGPNITMTEYSYAAGADTRKYCKKY